MDPDRAGAALRGALLGTAAGDALGLPFEGMSRRRVRRWLGRRPLEHRFFAGRGMVSDDTDHACLTAMSLAEAGHDPERFARRLAMRLRWWLATLPAGIGFGTLRGILKLWLGWSPARSGVWSAGNGPAMRAPVIGAFACADRDLRRALVRASTRVTHLDPRAEQGALAIAAAASLAASLAASPDGKAPFRAAELCRGVLAEIEDPELGGRLEIVAASLDVPTEEVVATWGNERGITGYIHDTVPAVLHAWLRHEGDIGPALTEIVRCGGDTDTTGAILGALCGVTRGAEAIPRAWTEGIAEWPRSVVWMSRLGDALARGEPPPPYFAPGLLARNAVFLAAVYLQIIRRALPPY